MQQLNVYGLNIPNLSNVNEVLGMGTNEMIISNYSLEIFLKICPEFKSVFDSTTSRFNLMYGVYFEWGKEVFTNMVYGGELYICITFFIAHYLQLAITRMKNVDNNANLNTQNESETVARDKGGKTSAKIMSDFQSSMSQTQYGVILYPIMQAIGQSRVRGVY
jgi:hypothetical protein